SGFAGVETGGVDGAGTVAADVPDPVVDGVVGGVELGGGFAGWRGSPPNTAPPAGADVLIVAFSCAVSERGGAATDGPERATVGGAAVAPSVDAPATGGRGFCRDSAVSPFRACAIGAFGCNAGSATCGFDGPFEGGALESVRGAAA